MRHLCTACSLALMLFGPIYAQERATITCDPDNPSSVPAWTEPRSAYIIEQLFCGQEVSISNLTKGFFAIQLGDRIGYVDAKYVRLPKVQEQSAEKSGGQSQMLTERRQIHNQAEAAVAEQRGSNAEAPEVVAAVPPAPDDSDSATSISRAREWPRRHDVGAYFDISHTYYGEANIMRNKGMMYGLSGDYTYRPNMFMLKAEARLSFGDVDYWSQGTGTAEDLRDYNLETRFILGYDLQHASKNTTITPFIGLGYRYLFDGSKDRITSTGHSGYDRKQSYLYSPIGLETIYKVGKKWSIGIAGEYDLFWHGWNKSEVDDADLSLVPLKFGQENGWGARASIKVMKDLGKNVLVVEPFFRYWKIDESDIDFSVTDLGYYGWNGMPYSEPENSTMEWGTRVGFRF